MGSRKRRIISGTFGLVGALFALAGCAPAGIEGGAVPRLNVAIEAARGPSEVATALQVLVLLTILTLAPSILIMITSFTRTIIVLSLVRNAIGIPQLPPNQVILGLSLFLTFFVMAPTWNRLNSQAIQPFLGGQITQEQAWEVGQQPIREFMFKQVREKDLSLFVFLAHMDQPQTLDDVPTFVLIPAYLISELKTAFQMGFIIFVPFLIIDLVVASTLMSMGMMMLPPVVISLPFKLLLFVLVDGWHLIVRSLVLSFGG